jgi:CheY-like chemotaxis protein
VAIQTDVTDRRRIEENLREATETALQLAQEKSGFLATMSHEIRTPLNAVLGVISLLQGTALDAEQQEYASTAERSGNLLLELVNDILDFSALDSGRIEIETRSFSVRWLLADIESMFGATAAASDVTIEVEIADSVSEFVGGDESRIRQVIVNLVSNGIKFAPAGRVSIRVDVDPGRPVGVRFRVDDSGIGIAADRQVRIFLPFTQVDASTTRKYGGTGLGLSICRLIAQQLGGTIDLVSMPGTGSTFTFWVPVVPVASVQLPAAGEGRDSAPADFAGLRVLLAEDDATNRMVALRMLARLGASAVVAKDGVDAVAAAAVGDFDLILMDVHMPRMDGIAATKEIGDNAVRSGSPRPRIVAVTANALEGDSERLLAAGMDGYLSKPVTLKALGQLLAAIATDGKLPRGRDRQSGMRGSMTDVPLSGISSAH